MEIATGEDDTDDPADNDGNNRRPWIGYCMVALVIAGFIVNIRVIWNVSKRPRLTERSGAVQHIRVAHLAVVTIALGATLLRDTMEDLIDQHLRMHAEFLQQSGPDRESYFCAVWKFWETTLISLFPLNVVGIIHERIKCPETAAIVTVTKPKLARLPLIFWTISLVISIPTGFIYDTNSSFGKCQPIQLYDSVWMTIFYELARFQIFHVTTVAYVIYALVKVCAHAESNAIHNKDRSFYNENSQSSRFSVSSISTMRHGKRFQSVHFVYMYLVSFILIWFFFGLLLCIEIISAFPILPPWHLSISPSSTISSFQAKFDIFLPIIYAYMFVTPYLNLHLIDGVFWCTCGRLDVAMFEDGGDVDGYDDEEDPSDIFQEENWEFQEQSSSEEQNWKLDPKQTHNNSPPTDIMTNISTCNAEVHPIPGHDNNDINDVSTSDSEERKLKVERSVGNPNLGCLT